MIYLYCRQKFYLPRDQKFLWPDHGLRNLKCCYSFFSYAPTSIECNSNIWLLKSLHVFSEWKHIKSTVIKLMFFFSIVVYLERVRNLQICYFLVHFYFVTLACDLFIVKVLSLPQRYQQIVVFLTLRLSEVSFTI